MRESNPLTLCLMGVSGESSPDGADSASIEDIAEACRVSGSGLVILSGFVSLLALLLVLCCLRRRASGSRLQMASRYERAARIAYICGILHICTCLCYWVVLTRTPYYYVLCCCFVGCIWMLMGVKFTKKADRLAQNNELTELLMHLFDSDSDSLDMEGGRASPEEPPVAPPLPGGGYSSEASEDDTQFIPPHVGDIHDHRGSDNGIPDTSEDVPMADEVIEITSDEEMRTHDPWYDSQRGGGGEEGREEEDQEEGGSSLPIAVGEAVEFASGEDPFDDSTDEEDHYIQDDSDSTDPE